MQKPRPEAVAAWAALLVAHRHLTSSLDAELRRDAGMGLDDYDILYQLRLAGAPLSMTELADRVLISRPTATRIVDRLVDRGWVDRDVDPDDRRVVRVALTSDGRRAQTKAARVHLDGLARFVDEPLAGHDVRSVAAALQALGGR